jgi:predicted NUDIX family NTP pyrophosphohydrolase
VPKVSAGILLHRSAPAGEGLEVLLVYPGGPYWTNKDRGAWSIPKGEVEEGEEALACALRELEEELGSRLEIGEDELLELGEVRQRGGKYVLCWAAAADFDPATLSSNTFTMEWPRGSGVEREFPEVERAEWFDLELARWKINAAQVAFLERLAEAQPRQA